MRETTRSTSQKPPTHPKLLTFARDMRREQTDAENKLWSRLRNRRLKGWKFRRQAPLSGYILDFFCDDARLCVELDGGQHADADDAAYDAGRDKALAKLGIRVMRFWDNDALRDTDAVLEQILRAVAAQLSNVPSP